MGDPRAADRAIMEWAVANGFVVLTHDLDFGAILALTHQSGPSVVQVRGQDVLPDRIGKMVVSAILQHENDLLSGALVIIEEEKYRARILSI